jgi:hypothetical protein
MNHDSHMHQQQEQQQQQINEIQAATSNLTNSPHAILTRSDSTSTVILEEEEETRTCHRNGIPTVPPPAWANLSFSLRSLLKTSGLFNNGKKNKKTRNNYLKYFPIGFESSDKLNELFASGNEFTLQRLLSEIGNNDANIDMNELIKLDSMKFLDSRTLSEFVSGKDEKFRNYKIFFVFYSYDPNHSIN